MAQHRIYTAIVNAVLKDRLQEPFSGKDFEAACPGFGKGTYNAFLYKHSKDTQGKIKASELFRRTAPGQFELIRPIKYDLDKLQGNHDDR